MSKSYKSKYQRQIVKNSFLKKILHCYSDEFYTRGNSNYLNRIVRARLKEKTMKETKEND